MKIQTHAFAIVTGILLAASAGFCWTVVWKFHDADSFHAGLKAALLLLPPAAFLITLYLRRVYGRNGISSADIHTRDLDSTSPEQAWMGILLSSCAALYIELMMIRLHATYFQLFAYYKNISLLSCFLGLGIGFATKQGRVLTPLVLPALLGQVLLLALVKHSQYEALLQNPVSEQLAMGLAKAQNLASLAITFSFIILVFSLNTLCFVPLGQLTSRLMARVEPLRSYAWNLAGSLAGILLFSLLSILWLGPVSWAALAVILVIFLLRRHASALMPSAVCGVILIAVLSLPAGHGSYNIYSPYQVLTVTLRNALYPEIKVNNVYFQHVLDISGKTDEVKGETRPWFEHYSIPYLFKPAPKKVLIVGSGSGNDAASALYHGAGHVDAVEIDPAILKLGRTFHPARPYDDSRVTPVVNDARAFIRQTDEKYDLIVYGLLDSHSLLSGFASVRLDSYVYTVEALKEARARLKEDGVLSLSFYVLSPELGRKLFLIAAFQACWTLQSRNE